MKVRISGWIATKGAEGAQRGVALCCGYIRAHYSFHNTKIKSRHIAVEGKASGGWRTHSAAGSGKCRDTDALCDEGGSGARLALAIVVAQTAVVSVTVGVLLRFE